MTSPVDLKFWRQVAPTPGAVDLRFGEPPSSSEVAGTLAAVLPAASTPNLTLSATGTQRAVVAGTLGATLPTATLPTLTFAAEQFVARTLGTITAALPPAIVPAVTLESAAVDYDQALPDAIGPGLSANQQHGATIAPIGLGANQQQFAPSCTPAAVPHTSADPLHVGASARQMQMLPAGQRTHTPWQHGEKVGGGSRAWHADMLRQRRTIATPAQHGIPVGQGARSEHQERIRFRHRLRTDQQQGIKTVTRATAGHQHGIPLAKGTAVLQQQMIPVPLGWWQIAYPWPEEPIDPNAPSSPVALKFCRLADGTNALIFGCPTPQQPDATVVVPIRRAYIVLNSASLTRVLDGAPIPTLSLSIGLDSSSWTWGFDASLPAEAQTLVEPSSGPVEVLATINGQSFRLVVESISRERRFGQVGVRISGRGRNAILDAPYSAAKSFTNTGDRTAQQLAADSLLENGVNVGLATIGEAWQVNWGLTDWLVPAGVWVHQGTHISALNAIAQAAGGYLRPDRTAATLHIEPRYPTAPWAWEAVNPDIELPSAVTIQESIQWQDKAPYNRVFVSGQQSGILGQVTRAGTAGDEVAPMVTDALITHADAARQRGISILGDTGRVANVTLSLPVLPETGIIEVGKFVRYVDGAVTRKGIVRSSSVSVGASAVDVRQQITLETHL